VKRYTFTCVLSEVPDDDDNPERFVRLALTYGDKHQDFVMHREGEVLVESYEEGE
jgi:hypothetical protein